MNSTKKIKIAFVHDDFIQFGGAEKLFLEVIRDFQDDQNFEIVIFSSIISPEWKETFHNLSLKFVESFLGFLPYSYLYSRLFFVNSFFYYAFESFDFSEFDVVISSSTRFGHFVITKPSTIHISYVNSPSRALWDERKYFFNKRLFYFLIKSLLPKKRIYDFYSQFYADLVICNSLNIKRKVSKIYGRKSIVLFPFVSLKNIDDSNNKISDDYFLIISRLISWKRIDYVIDTFNNNNLKLVVVGEGEELVRYQKISNPNITFTGYISDEKKNNLLKNATALIFPQNEDFGITILEALNCSIPVVYLNKGGAKEILNNKVGISYESQSSSDLEKAIFKVRYFNFDKEESKYILERYSKDKFVRFLKKLVLNTKKQ